VVHQAVRLAFAYVKYQLPYYAQIFGIHPVPRLSAYLVIFINPSVTVQGSSIGALVACKRSLCLRPKDRPLRH
jgi:hypothetical protein